VIASVFSPEWLMSILKLYWTNIRAIFWPRNLALTYEWIRPESLLDAVVILGATAVVLTCAALWMLRRRPPALFGLLWFGIALGPTSQIMPHYVAQADRFLYLPLVGLAIAAAVAAKPLGWILERRGVIEAAPAAPALGLLLLGLLASHQVRTWQNDFAVWNNCLMVSPNNYIAHRFLADEYASAGQFDEAYYHYKEALRLNTENEKALSNFARMLVTDDDLDNRDYELALRLAHFACEITEWNDPEMLRTLAMVYNNRAVELGDDREYERAVACYNRAIETDPEYVSPVFNLALLWATCGDEQFRQGDRAVRMAVRGCEIVGRPGANHLMILAAAYAEAGSSDEAIRTMEQAVRQAISEDNPYLADLIRDRLMRYKAQVSTRDSNA
jgi:protein O-mannosyl-transferase